MGIINSLNNHALKQGFEENGYITLKNAFDVGHINNILSETQSIFMIQAQRKGIDTRDLSSAIRNLFVNHRKVFKNCGKQAQHLVDAWKLACDEKLMNVLINVCGLKFPNICTRPVTMFNSISLSSNEGYHTLSAHQDSISMRGSSNAVVVWLPLAEISQELGPLQIVPSSHLKGNLADDIDEFGFGIIPDSMFKDEEFISLEGMGPGDAVIFNSHLVHRSGKLWTDSGIRWTLQFRYNDLLDERFIEEDFVNPYIYRPMTEKELNNE